MSGNGKTYRAALEKIDRSQRYLLEDSLRLAKETARAKFDETVEMAIRLGVDPRQADQNIRGTVTLPHGMGKSVRVLAFAKGDKEKEAQDAGADFVGSDELIKKISEGWLDFDKAVATPDMMGAVGRIGKILGPRGLMPNPKTGTVAMDIGKAVKEIKAGKLEFRVDKAGIVHVPVGKASFGERRTSSLPTRPARDAIRRSPTRSSARLSSAASSRSGQTTLRGCRPSFPRPRSRGSTTAGSS